MSAQNSVLDGRSADVDDFSPNDSGDVRDESINLLTYHLPFWRYKARTRPLLFERFRSEDG